VLDDFSTGRRENLPEGVEVIEASVSDASAVRDAMRGVDVAFHQAAIVSVPQTVADPIGSHTVNALGTLHVLEAARHANVARVVFASSCAVYGEDERVPKVESLEAAPGSPYALQKLAGELDCRLYTKLYGLETVALRYFNVYGPRQDANSTYAGVIPRFVSALVARETPVIYGDGEQTRDFIHVSDVVAANRAAAIQPDVAGGVFNIGRGERVSVLALLEAIASEMDAGKVVAEHRPPRDGDVRHSLADVSLAGSLLDWRARTGLVDGLPETIRFYEGERG
jgi:UDP-glucose 4-epimerase